MPLLKVLSIIGLFFILGTTSARGAAITYVVIIFYYLWIINKKRILNVTIAIVATAIIALILVNFKTIESSVLTNVSILGDFINLGGGDRLYMMWASTKMFLEEPLLGYGFGNWHLISYKYDLSNIYPFNDALTFVRFRSHNLFFQILSELGVLGFAAFMIPTLIILFKNIKTLKGKNPLVIASFGALLAYLIISMFYATTNVYPFHFSGPKWIAFTSLGVLSMQLSTKFMAKRIHYVYLILLCIPTSTWFIYAAYANNTYYFGKRAMIKGDTNRAIGVYQKLYNPIFKTSHNDFISLTYELAKLHEQKGEHDIAEDYYEQSVKLNPYDGDILVDYSYFLLNIRQDPDRAKIFGDRLMSIQPGNKIVNLLYANILLAQKNYSDIQSYLNKSYDPRFKHEISLLEVHYYNEYYLPQFTDESGKSLEPVSLVYDRSTENEILHTIRSYRKEQLEEDLARPTFSKAWIQINDFESDIKQALNQSAYDNYLNQKLFNRFNYEFQCLSNILALDDLQIQRVSEILFKDGIEIEKLNFKIYESERAKNESTSKSLQLQNNEILSEFDKKIIELLTPDQINTYQNQYRGNMNLGQYLLLREQIIL